MSFLIAGGSLESSQCVCPAVLVAGLRVLLCVPGVESSSYLLLSEAARRMGNYITLEQGGRGTIGRRDRCVEPATMMMSRLLCAKKRKMVSQRGGSAATGLRASWILQTSRKSGFENLATNKWNE